MSRRMCILLLVSAGLAASACDPAQPAPDAAPSVPSMEIATRAIELLLPGLRFGADEATETYREIRSVRVAGSHFVPARNHYVVHYCVGYVSVAGAELRERCDLNVQLYTLDTNKWVGLATGMGTLYRWRVIEPEEKPAPAASTEP